MQITALRVTVVYAISRDENPWSILEWCEDDSTEAMSIYQLTEGSGDCGYLMHRGVVSRGSKPTTTGRWEHSSILWRVGDIAQLKALFGGVCHLTELLAWSLDDLLKLYCGSQLQDSSEKTYPSHRF